MNTEVKKNIAGLSMKGGRTDRFFFCLLEYFPDFDRWSLHSLLQVKDAVEADGRDDAIRVWIEKYQVKDLVVDFPLSNPACQNCQLECPGVNQCPEEGVSLVRQSMSEILKADESIHNKHPKSYEKLRNVNDEFDHGRDILSKSSHDHLLSRPFKRKLKKGFLPYWNRTLDYYIWSHYYDQMQELFNITFDSFGNTNLMVQSRFAYLKRHFPNDCVLYESNYSLALIELFRKKILQKKDILSLKDMELGVETKLQVIKKIELSQKIFIYDHDLDILLRHPHAFESFIMAVCGQNKIEEKNVALPGWTSPEKTRFIVPQF